MNSRLAVASSSSTSTFTFKPESKGKWPRPSGSSRPSLGEKLQIYVKKLSGRGPRSKRQHKYLLIVVLIVLLCSALLFFPIPQSQSVVPGVVLSRYPNYKPSLLSSPVAALARLIALVPEDLQSGLGTRLFSTAVAPSLSQMRQHKLLSLRKDLYHSINDAPRWRNVRSELGLMYLSILGLKPGYAHFYLYVPTTADSGSGAVLLFFHGSFGNFQLYPELMIPFAEKTGTIIVAPSGGFGNWAAPAEDEVISAVLTELRHIVDLDSKNVFVSGQSAGGVGVAKFMRAYPKTAAALLISPVIDSKLFSSLQAKLGGTQQQLHLTVISGEQDEATRIGMVREAVRALRAAGLDVRLHEEPGEDHYLMLFRWPVVEAALEEMVISENAFKRGRAL